MGNFFQYTVQGICHAVALLLYFPRYKSQLLNKLCTKCYSLGEPNLEDLFPCGTFTYYICFHHYIGQELQSCKTMLPNTTLYSVKKYQGAFEIMVILYTVL